MMPQGGDTRLRERGVVQCRFYFENGYQNGNGSKKLPGGGEGPFYLALWLEKREDKKREEGKERKVNNVNITRTKPFKKSGMGSKRKKKTNVKHKNKLLGLGGGKKGTPWEKGHDILSDGEKTAQV